MAPGTKTVLLASNAENAAPNDEVVKDAETLAVEGEAVDLSEVDDDRKGEVGSHSGSTSDRVACRSLPAGPGQDAPCEYSVVEFEASYV